MADRSAIEWTEATWNPTTGCDRVSPGCDHCYAMSLAPRLKAMGSKRYQRDGDPRTSGPGFGLSLHSDTVSLPMRWTRPRRIFVNSMSDLFHNEVPDRFIADVFAVMTIAEKHTFQLLTKRHGRMRSLLSSVRFWRAVSAARNVRGYDSLPDTGAAGFEPPSNVWLGVSVEDQQWADIRIPALLETPAAIRWLSCEPLLGPVDIFRSSNIDRDPGLDWVVVGGESGIASRPMELAWVRSLRDECVGAEIPFFFKQWGGRTPKANGRELDGRTWDQYPDGDRG
jgi:protein gp37